MDYSAFVKGVIKGKDLLFSPFSVETPCCFCFTEKATMEKKEEFLAEESLLSAAYAPDVDFAGSGWTFGFFSVAVMVGEFSHHTQPTLKGGGVIMATKNAKTALENSFLGEVFQYQTEDGELHTAMTLYADLTEDSYIFGKGVMAYNHIGYRDELGGSHFIDHMVNRYSDRYTRMNQKVLETAVVWQIHGEYTGFRPVRHLLITQQEYAIMSRLLPTQQKKPIDLVAYALEAKTIVTERTVAFA